MTYFKCMDKKYKNLSKAISHALRHAPSLYGVILEDEGWTDVDQVLIGIYRARHLKELPDRKDVEFIITNSEKQRFELKGDKIRALYGHSVEQNIAMVSSEPPQLLYHGTSPNVVEAIRSEGLKPMKRQYVHLSSDEKTAILVGKRKNRQPVILKIQALQAHESGVYFYDRNDKIWLVETIPPKYIEF